MEFVKIASKEQITIPISIRRKLEVKDDDKIIMINLLLTHFYKYKNLLKMLLMN